MDKKIDVKAIREQLGLSPKDFAVALGVAVQTVHRWQTSNRDLPPHRVQQIKHLIQGKAGLPVALADFGPLEVDATDINFCKSICEQVGGRVNIMTLVDLLRQKKRGKKQEGDE